VGEADATAVGDVVDNLSHSRASELPVVLTRLACALCGSNQGQNARGCVCVCVCVCVCRMGGGVNEHSWCVMKNRTVWDDVGRAMRCGKSMSPPECMC
jgi:hypothetical protein